MIEKLSNDLTEESTEEASEKLSEESSEEMNDELNEESREEPSEKFEMSLRELFVKYFSGNNELPKEYTVSSENTQEL